MSSSSDAFLRLPLLTPAISHVYELLTRKNSPVSFATALAKRVLPVSGGPNIKTPRGGLYQSTSKAAGGEAVVRPFRAFANIVVVVANVIEF